MDRREARWLIGRLKRDAERIARRFELSYGSIEAERPGVRGRYGICYSDGIIRIRLRHVTTGRPLKYSSLVNTLCHEMAHLRHFDHGPRFKAFYLGLLDYARAEGIYRPGPQPGLAKPAPPRAPEGTPGAVQLDLF
jgi:predicted metal-dependent hydrolase